jgi:3-hydroxyacyl-CoA dehydrogenase
MSRITKVAVIGGGLMGSGIAQVSAAAGLRVNLIDVKDAILKSAMTTIEKNIFRGYKKSIESKKIDEASARQEVDKILARINCHAKAEDAVSDVDLVIEAATENLSIKHKIFASIDNAAPAHTIFASNTSSIQIKDICTAVNRTDRFAGLHFFNPVPVMKLMEVFFGFLSLSIFCLPLPLLSYPSLGNNRQNLNYPAGCSRSVHQ